MCLSGAALLRSRPWCPETMPVSARGVWQGRRCGVIAEWGGARAQRKPPERKSVNREEAMGMMHWYDVRANDSVTSLPDLRTVRVPRDGA